MLKYLILFSALFISLCAAWFSVTGISQLFIGEQTAAIIMAISLELAKLVSVSFVYRYWSILNKTLRSYLLIGSIILSIITSMGIYGYLSAAYASAAVDYTAKQNNITLLQSRQAVLSSQIQSNNNRISQLESYRDKQETRLDSLVGKSGFLTQQRIIRASDDEIKSLQSHTRQLILQKDSLQIQEIDTQNSTSTNTKLGTFSYISSMIGVPLDIIVKWFILIIVCVFDPLAVSLLICYNFLITKAPVERSSLSGPTSTPSNDTSPVLEPSRAVFEQSAQTVPSENSTASAGATEPHPISGAPFKVQS